MSDRLGTRLDRNTPIVPTVDLLNRVARLERRLALLSGGDGGGSVGPGDGAGAGRVMLFPSGDTSGVTDDQHLADAVAQLPSGGVIAPVVGPFYTQAAHGWNPPAQTTPGPTGGGPVSIEGIAWPILYPRGSSTGIWYHRTDEYGTGVGGPTPEYRPPVGRIYGVVIDGRMGQGQRNGIDVGDGFNHDVEVVVQRFQNGSAQNAHGAHLSNRAFHTEKSKFRIWGYDNDTQVWITYNGATGGNSSWEYNDLQFWIIASGPDQNGVVIDNVNLGGSGGRGLSIYGNMGGTSVNSGPPPTHGQTGMPVAALTLRQSSSNARIYQNQIWMKVERNVSGGSVYPYTIVSDGNGSIQECSGQITTGQNGIHMAGAEFTFSGVIGSNDFTETLSDIYPSLPSAFGTDWRNMGPDAQISVQGGNVTGILINGVGTGAAANWASAPYASYWLGAKQTLRINGSGAFPSVTLIPARVMT